ncbi:MAG: hypothetical protein WCH39_08145 [Schlesneria sp.]
MESTSDIAPAQAGGTFRTQVFADPGDDQILATAIAASPDVLSALDRHLRTTTVVSHCQQKGIAILDDVELLQLLKSPPHGAVMDLD